MLRVRPNWLCLNNNFVMSTGPQGLYSWPDTFSSCTRVLPKVTHSLYLHYIITNPYREAAACRDIFFPRQTKLISALQEVHTKYSHGEKQPVCASHQYTPWQVDSGVHRDAALGRWQPKLEPQCVHWGVASGDKQPLPASIPKQLKEDTDVMMWKLMPQKVIAIDSARISKATLRVPATPPSPKDSRTP